MVDPAAVTAARRGAARLSRPVAEVIWGRQLSGIDSYLGSMWKETSAASPPGAVTKTL